MTAPGTGRRGEVAEALADDRVVAVPGCGGYELVARLHSDPALLALNSFMEDPHEVERHVAIGRISDAKGLASEWSETTGQLAESVWPGPVMVVVPAGDDVPFAGANGGPSVRLTIPTHRGLRRVARQIGPLAVVMPRLDGAALTTAEAVRARFAPVGSVLVLDGGTRQGPGPTIVDCRVSPPVVLRVGELPEAYIDGVLLMAARRRKRFRFFTSRRSSAD